MPTRSSVSPDPANAEPKPEFGLHRSWLDLPVFYDEDPNNRDFERIVPVLNGDGSPTDRQLRFATTIAYPVIGDLVVIIGVEHLRAKNQVSDTLTTTRDAIQEVFGPRTEDLLGTDQQSDRNYAWSRLVSTTIVERVLVTRKTRDGRITSSWDERRFTALLSNFSVFRRQASPRSPRLETIELGRFDKWIAFVGEVDPVDWRLLLSLRAPATQRIYLVINTLLARQGLRSRRSRLEVDLEAFHRWCVPTLPSDGRASQIRDLEDGLRDLWSAEYLRDATFTDSTVVLRLAPPTRVTDEL